MSTLQIESCPPQRFTSIDGAARYTTLSRPVIERLLRDKKLRAYHPGGCRRVVVAIEELDRLITDGAA